MDDRKAELVAAWFLKAQHDLEAARILIHKEKRLFDMAAYHCHQAGEKALKGYLTQRDIVFPKTHSLVQLIHLITPVTPDFASLMHQAKALTPLADEFRYPGDVNEPSAEEAAQALSMAEEIYRFCEQQIEESDV